MGRVIKMKIRRVVVGDLERIDEIYVEGSIDEGILQFSEVKVKEILKDLKRFKKKRIDGWKNELKSKNNYWIVWEEKGFLFGFGNAEIKKNYDYKEGVISMVYVDRRFRGKGIGKKILKELIYWLKTNKVKYIEAGFYYNNKPSIEMHKKFGFKPISLKMRLN